MLTFDILSSLPFGKRDYVIYVQCCSRHCWILFGGDMKDLFENVDMDDIVLEKRRKKRQCKQDWIIQSN